jgi:glutathione S-transferase
MMALAPNHAPFACFCTEKHLACRPSGRHPRRPESPGAAPGAQPDGGNCRRWLDNQRCIAEVTAICEYIEDTHPAPPLIGTTPEDKAETRMWTRRLDLNVCEPIGNAFRFGEGLAIFQDRIRCIPEASAGLKQIAQDTLAKVDAHLAARLYLCGDRFTLADVLLYAFLDFAHGVGQPLDPAKRNLQAWFERVGARPSAAASLNPAAVNAGLRG